MKMQISASIAALEIDTYYFRFQLKNLESRRMSAFILELAIMHNYGRLIPKVIIQH